MFRVAHSVLAVEGAPAARQRIAGELRPQLDVWCADSVEQALELLAERPFDVIVTDLELPDGDGLTVLVAAASLAPSSARVLLWESARHDPRVPAGLEGLRHEALARPWIPGALREAVVRLLPPPGRHREGQSHGTR